MIERRFHRDLYPPTAIEGAVKVYARFARFEVVEAGDYQVVRVTGKSAERERKIALELGNYALGLTRRGGLS